MVPRRRYPGRRPWLRGREAPPFQRTRLEEHSGVLTLAVVMLLALALLAVFIIAH